MKSKAIFYHAGCSVCLDAEKQLASALDPSRYQVEIIHLGEQKQHINDAEKQGVKSVPALVLNDQVFHINFGADLSVLK